MSTLKIESSVSEHGHPVRSLDVLINGNKVTVKEYSYKNKLEALELEADTNLFCKPHNWGYYIPSNRVEINEENYSLEQFVNDFVGKKPTKHILVPAKLSLSDGKVLLNDTNLTLREMKDDADTKVTNTMIISNEYIFLDENNKPSTVFLMKNIKKQLFIDFYIKSPQQEQVIPVIAKISLPSMGGRRNRTKRSRKSRRRSSRRRQQN